MNILDQVSDVIRKKHYSIRTEQAYIEWIKRQALHIELGDFGYMECAERLGEARETIRNHLAEMAELPNQPKADLSKGYTVSQVAEKHGWLD